MVELRQVERTDLEQLRDWRNADWMLPYVRQYRLLTMDDQEAWYEHIRSSSEVEMFVIMSHGMACGVCGLTHIRWPDRTAEISIYVIPAYQGQGVAAGALHLLEAKAWDVYNLNRLWAEVYVSNGRSVALFEGAGYSHEGTMRSHVYKAGVYTNARIYGKLKCER